MSPRARTHILLAALLVVALAGCADPYERDRTQPAPEPAPRPASPTDNARPGPPAAPFTPPLVRAAAPARRAARSFAEAWINWDWQHAARQQRALARLATGALAQQLRANAVSARINATLARDRPGSRGSVVTTALRASNAQADGIVVTHEQSLTDGHTALGGLRYRVYVVRLRRATGAWEVSAWQQQP
jgi:hypothetical protein